MLLPFKVFGHVDVDAFYASAAQARNRFLRDKPVGILSNQAYFVVARSLELKKFGVKTGEPLPDAIQKCPQAIFVKRERCLRIAKSIALMNVSSSCPARKRQRPLQTRCAPP
jgi:nucleotidyltransferase/DNA polymerase involved in DNA repair